MSGGTAPASVTHLSTSATLAPRDLQLSRFLFSCIMLATCLVSSSGLLVQPTPPGLMRIVQQPGFRAETGPRDVIFPATFLLSDSDAAFAGKKVERGVAEKKKCPEPGDFNYNIGSGKSGAMVSKACSAQMSQRKQVEAAKREAEQRAAQRAFEAQQASEKGFSLPSLPKLF